MPFSIKETPSGLVFKIHVQPRSSKNVIMGVHGDALKIKLTAPPVEGKANKACIQFLARCLEVAKSDLEIVSGHSSRTKQIHVELSPRERTGITEKARLMKALQDLAGE